MIHLHDVTAVQDTGDPHRGRGVFSARHISARTVLNCGENFQILQRAVVLRLPPITAALCYDCEFDDGCEICPADFKNPPPCFFVNHSCDPNTASTDGWETVVTLRDVTAGEEITCDYATINAVKKGFRCCCGAANCRNVVTENDWMIPELQERYHGYFAKSIQARIAAFRLRTHRPV